jgi:hypothetical protein
MRRQSPEMYVARYSLGKIRKDLEMNKLDGQVKGGQQNEIAANKRVNSFQYFSHKLCTGMFGNGVNGIRKGKESSTCEVQKRRTKQSLNNDCCRDCQLCH